MSTRCCKLVLSSKNKLINVLDVLNYFMAQNTFRITKMQVLTKEECTTSHVNSFTSAISQNVLTSKTSEQLYQYKPGLRLQHTMDRVIQHKINCFITNSFTSYRALTMFIHSNMFDFKFFSVQKSYEIFPVTSVYSRGQVIKFYSGASVRGGG